jgi:peroxiredoxin
MSISDTATQQVVPNSEGGGSRVSGVTRSASMMFWLGTLAAIALIPIFGLQAFWARVLVTPWYLPIGGTVAAIVVTYALSRSWRWWKVPIAAVCVMLAGLEWYFLLGLTVLPQYTGPIASGGPLPAFQATWADGSAFDGAALQLKRPTVLVFFQGRWCPFCMTQLQELESQHADFEQAGADVVVVSIENVETAAETQRDFPHLKVASDEQRQLSEAVQLINNAVAPDGSDAATPTILILDGDGQVQWLHRPTRVITRPSADELLSRLVKLGR